MSASKEQISIKDHFKCPVCAGLYVKPTMFECGHTMCLACHYKLDKSSPSPTFEVPQFKCPLCRYTTTVPWNKRSSNVVLDKICKIMYPEEYAELQKTEERCADLTKRLKKHVIKKNGISEELKNLNLSETANNAQSQLANRVYEKLMPIFSKAATEGKSYVSVGEKKLVGDIEICIQPLTKKLFENNNVYKVTCTPEECTVYFSQCSMRWGREFRNDNHTGETVPDNLQTPPAPPGRRRLTRPLERILFQMPLT